MAVTTARRAIVAWRGAQQAARGDDLAVESPLVLGLDDEVMATLMRTPGHDIELAAGWLVVESGVRQPDDIASLRACWQEGTDRVHISLRDGVAPPRPRAFVSSSACGVCSADVLDLSLYRRSAPHSPDWTVPRSVLSALPETMSSHQRGFARTGGMHAAALADSSGVLGWVA